jgi:hypothetical protein
MHMTTRSVRETDAAHLPSRGDLQPPEGAEQQLREEKSNGHRSRQDLWD